MPKRESKRAKESRQAADILRKILPTKPIVPGVKPQTVRDALSLAIDLLDARTFDAQDDPQ